MTGEEEGIECPYFARVLGSVIYGKNSWDGQRVGIFERQPDGTEKKIGEYERNYPAMGESTFAPFIGADGQWYALYSRDYTATRIMTLPGCVDIGGEEPAGHGFCPVELYVPVLCAAVVDPADPEPVVANHQSTVWCRKVKGEDGIERWFWPDSDPEATPERKAAYLKAKEESHAAHKAWAERHPFVYRYAPFGFVAGCVWGDDSSWKVEHLDISRAHEGILVRDGRLGYIELPSGLSLKTALDTESIFRVGPGVDYHVHIATQVRVNLSRRYSEVMLTLEEP